MTSRKTQTEVYLIRLRWWKRRKGQIRGRFSSEGNSTLLEWQPIGGLTEHRGRCSHLLPAQAEHSPVGQNSTKSLVHSDDREEAGAIYAYIYMVYHRHAFCFLLNLVGTQTISIDSLFLLSRRMSEEKNLTFMELNENGHRH